MNMELAELAMKKALQMSATEVETYTEKTKTTRVEFAEEIESIKTVESLGMSLRIALGKKIATCSTSILGEKEINEAVEKAVKIARVAPEDASWKRLNRKFGKSSAEGYQDRTLESLEYGEITEKLVSAINKMRDHDERVKPTRGILTISASDISIANSYNETCARKETNIEVWMRTKAKDADMESTGNEHQETRFWREINFENLAEKAAEKALKFLKAKPVPSGKMPIIFRNQIFASILGVILSGPVNADWVQKGRSPLANKLGTRIASENINIVDDGLMRGGWQTKPFDDEGHPTQTTPVVEDGAFRNYLYDTYTALKDSVESTGNAQRPYYWTNPQPSPSNLVLKTGEASPEEIIRETKRGVYIEETIGDWLSNPVSGNLNATITHGYLVKNGELSEPVKGIVISGNFYELLKDGIEIVGNDLRNSAQYYSPAVKLTQMTIAGKE
jgi:PmbA protein